MIVTTQVQMKNGESQKVELPNLTHNVLILHKLEMFRLVKKSEEETVAEPADQILVTVVSGTGNLAQFEAPYFQITNEIDLSDHQAVLKQGHNVRLTVGNKSEGYATYLIHAHYHKSYGNIVYQTNTPTLDAVMNDIFTNTKQCTRIVLNFSRPVVGVQLVSIIDRVGEDLDEDEWCDSLTLSENNEAQSNFVFDLTDKEFAIYAKMLNFMKLTTASPLVVKTDDNHTDALKVAVVAYGYSN